ncbi:MAG TPA: type 2 isopentenyl-diphosphate Delta-isomerase [Anaeromyxobacter sp.]
MDAPMDRKDSHLDLALHGDVEFPQGDANGFGAFRFDHDALPEVDAEALDTRTTLLGKPLAAPLVVAAMTGGTARGAEMNRRLALAAARCGVALALGSQRKMLDDPAVGATFAARAWAPDLPLLLANLGAVQLNYGVEAGEVRRLVAQVGADALELHLNPLQEAIQPGGDTRFSGLLARIRAIAPEVGVPVLLKEVGSGISETTALKIRELPVAGVETAGVGGTSWSRIESLRTADGVKRAVGERFTRWGIPTAESVAICRRVLGGRVVIASGGIRHGIEVAKAIALGADAAAIALPILRAAASSVDDAVETISRVIAELRTVMFLTGARTVADLRTRRLVRARDLTAEAAGEPR